MTPGTAPPGFRLPAETRVGSVVLQVSALQRSLDFYERMLGLELIDREADTARLGVGRDALVELHGGAQRPRTGKRLGLYHFAILLPDRPALGRRLAHLIDSGMRPGASDHLVSEALYLHDPDGLGIEIYRDRPRAEWRVVGDELAMASEPLDFEGVLRAGDGHSPDRAPAGTRMGHIHLQVGDLEEAKAFYHVGLGFDVVVSSYPGALFMSAGGYHHHLGVNTWAGPTAVQTSADEARLLWWELLIPSRSAVEEAANSLAKAGYAVEREAVGVVAAADPWGTTVRLKTQES